MRKLFLSSFLSLALVLNLAPHAFAEYTDVNTSHKYSSAVYFISAEGIVEGYKDGTYKPENPINRAELLKIIVAANYTDADYGKFGTESCFDDVKAGEWYTPYTCFAKDKGLIKGYEDNTFRPDKSVTFVEALKIVVEGYKFEYSRSAEPWYKNLVEEASVNNLIPLDISGFNDILNRGQMADMITRIIYLKNGKLSEYLGYKTSCRVSYDSLSAGYKVESNCIDPAAPDNQGNTGGTPNETDPQTTPDDSENGGTSGLPVITEKMAWFENPNFGFKVQYPAKYYYIGLPGTETGVERKYTFGTGVIATAPAPVAPVDPVEPEDGTTPAEEPVSEFPDSIEEVIALEILKSDFVAPGGLSTVVKMGEYEGKKYIINGKVEIYFTALGRNFRLKAAIEMEDILLHMGASITAL